MGAVLKIVRIANYICGCFLSIFVILSILHFFNIFSPIAGIYNLTISALIACIVLGIIEGVLRRI